MKKRYQINRGTMILSKYKHLIIISFVFLVIYSLISLINHYLFRTYALDLGAYTNALFDYIRFQWNDSTVFKAEAENLLADHFDLYLIIFSPLSLLFGTYTLLIVQIAFIILGGWGVYSYFDLVGNNNKLAVFAALFFFMFFGVFSAVSNDYHSNVVAASLVPWLFYFTKKRALLKSSILIFLIIISKENISLWLAFICLGLAIEYRKESPLLRFHLIGALASLVYFIAITSVVMPAFSNSNAYPHFHYSVLGEGPREAFFTLLSNPLDSLNDFFTNHTGHPHGDYVKTELHILLIISGLPMLLFRPHYLLMLVPVYLQKLFHDNYIMWGISAQYNIEFAPVLAIGIFSVIGSIKKRNTRIIALVLVLTGTLSSTIRIMDNTVMFTNKSKIRFYQASHYKRDFNVKKVHELLSTIPEDAIVSVQSPFLPHLALRDKVYQFPIIKDAEYIVFSRIENPYPVSQHDFDVLTHGLQNFSFWKTLHDSETLTILKKAP